MVYICVAVAFAGVVFLRGTDLVYLSIALSILVGISLTSAEGGWVSVLTWVLWALVLLTFEREATHRIGFKATVSEVRQLVDTLICRGGHRTTIRIKHPETSATCDSAPQRR